MLIGQVVFALFGAWTTILTSNSMRPGNDSMILTFKPSMAGRRYLATASNELIDSESNFVKFTNFLNV